ncbi:MAG: VRR-NUC domain-containing protein [Terasakiella sp.]|uniref:VRR-NUC domain-containing protein n=1 Tax=unclassified Terasakiella TaxID=2614952 RepID=UPI003AFF999E
MARKRGPGPEEILQKQVATWLHVALPDAVGFWFHVPNGGKRTKAEAGIFKAMGVRSGVPDLCFINPDGKAFFIEMKAPGRRSDTSENQDAVLGTLSNLNASVAVCDSLSSVETTLKEWGFKLKAKLQ